MLGPAVVRDHLDGEPAGAVRGLEQPAVGGRGAGDAGQGHAERLGHAAPSSTRCPSCCSGRGCGSSTDSDLRKSSSESVPARTSSREPPDVGAAAQRASRGRSRSASGRRARRRPAGRPTRRPSAATGIVLSQPPSRTTPSTGLARSISSVAIAAMLRQSIAVGRTCVSPSDTTGSSSGTPPASQTPSLDGGGHLGRGARCTASGRTRCWRSRCAGRPSNASAGRPRRIQARWM